MLFRELTEDGDPQLHLEFGVERTGQDLFAQRLAPRAAR
jgi:hypothetical protein